ncbi:hypothetical protein UPYG_G00295310 [Umbra pygmaea]|uniref:Ubiquitin-like domain-containing protein n=1 Tax=Umbra pygmaea TaxID=75934 RepID=A0ABD0W5I8_UMBPY
MRMDHRQAGTRSFFHSGDPVCSSVPTESSMRLSISSTTGSRFELSVHRGETVEVLRRRISQKLKVPKERFVLLYKETRLCKGKLQDFGVISGSRLTLVPTIEAGLSSQSSRTKQTIMQALESLTESQVSDFLSGRSPLTLALRVGEHMMFVQVQLAPQSTAGQQLRCLNPRSTGRAEQVHPGKCGCTRLPYAHPSPAQLAFNTPGSGEKDSSATFSTDTPSSNSHTPYPSHISSSPPCSSSGPNIPDRASTYPKGDCSVTGSPTSKSPSTTGEPSAVIESLMSHAPGVFSGTFSGTLPPAGQDSSRSTRRGVNIILQILDDLLSATRHHQGALLSLSQLCCPPPSSSSSSTPCSPTSPSPPPSPLTPDPLTITTSEPRLDHTSQAQSNSHPPAGLGASQVEENQALRGKLERLHVLMHERRLRRRARSDTRTSNPYPHNHRKPWSPGRRKANGRLRSNESLSSGEGSSLDELELPWKPELPSDLVMA